MKTMKTMIALLFSLAFACPALAQTPMPLNVDTDYKAVIPPGTIKGVLLTGIRPQKNAAGPTPVLIKLNGELSGPGESKDKKLDGCMLLAESSYILSEGRFYVRTVELTCINNFGLYISTPVKGFLSSSDKFIGLNTGTPGQSVLVAFKEPFCFTHTQ